MPPRTPAALTGRSATWKKPGCGPGAGTKLRRSPGRRGHQGTALRPPEMPRPVSQPGIWGPWHDSSSATRGTTIHRARRRRREARATDQRRSRQAASIRLPAEAWAGCPEHARALTTAACPGCSAAKAGPNKGRVATRVRPSGMRSAGRPPASPCRLATAPGLRVGPSLHSGTPSRSAVSSRRYMDRIRSRLTPGMPAVLRGVNVAGPRAHYANQCKPPGHFVKKRMMRGASYSLCALDFVPVLNVSHVKSSDPRRPHKLLT